MKTNHKNTPSEEIALADSPVLSEASKKRLYRLMALLTYGLFVLNTVVLSPILVSLDSDVMTSDTVFPSLVSVLMHLIHLAVIPAAAWTLIGFSYDHKGAASVSRRLVAMYFGSLIFCRFCDMVMALTINGSLYLNEDIIYPAWYLVLDLIYNLALFLMVRFYLSRHRSLPVEKQHRGLIRRFAVVFTAVALLQEGIYTVAFLYDSTNPMTGEEITVMAGRYLDAFLIGLAFYLLSRLLYRFLANKAKCDEE